MLFFFCMQFLFNFYQLPWYGLGTPFRWPGADIFFLPAEYILQTTYSVPKGRYSERSNDPAISPNGMQPSSLLHFLSFSGEALQIPLTEACSGFLEKLLRVFKPLWVVRMVLVIKWLWVIWPGGLAICQQRYCGSPQALFFLSGWNYTEKITEGGWGKKIYRRG